MKGSPAVPGGPSTSKADVVGRPRRSTMSAFFGLAGVSRSQHLGKESNDMIKRWKMVPIVAVFVFGVGVTLRARSSSHFDAKAADDAPRPLDGFVQGQEADEKAIRASADEFVKAFNAADAAVIAAQWAPDAEYTDESGRVFHGRPAIEKEYAELFKEHPGATIAVTIESIHFLAPDIATERGIATVKFPNADASVAARYNVVHAKCDGKWTIVVGSDAVAPPPKEDHLKPLEWLVGEWTTDAENHGLRISFEWMAERNFIKSTFTATKEGQSTLTGGQIIGWNPKLGRIVSWHFDAQGGFGQDIWSETGSPWVIDATGILRDGSESTAVNVLTPIDADSFTWQSVKRTLGEVSLPSTGPVKVVRLQPTR
jgi:uncharacterized protein (TIGR02246 family)